MVSIQQRFKQMTRVEQARKEQAEEALRRYNEAVMIYGEDSTEADDAYQEWHDLAYNC